MPKVYRRVKRNIERAVKGRTFNEKRSNQIVFMKGIQYGVDMEKSRLLSSTAHLTYEEEVKNEVTPSDSVGTVLDISGVPVGGEELEPANIGGTIFTD